MAAIPAERKVSPCIRGQPGYMRRQPRPAGAPGAVARPQPARAVAWPRPGPAHSAQSCPRGRISDFGFGAGWRPWQARQARQTAATADLDPQSLALRRRRIGSRGRAGEAGRGRARDPAGCVCGGLGGLGGLPPGPPSSMSYARPTPRAAHWGDAGDAVARVGHVTHGGTAVLQRQERGARRRQGGRAGQQRVRPRRFGKCLFSSCFSVRPARRTSPFLARTKLALNCT